MGPFGSVIHLSIASNCSTELYLSNQPWLSNDELDRNVTAHLLTYRRVFIPSFEIRYGASSVLLLRAH
jgi:hypothetical protein